MRTERLLLRQWRDEDAEPLAEIYAQPEFLEHMPPLDLAGTRAQIGRFQDQWRELGLSHWAAIDAESGVLIGRIGLLRHRDWPLAQLPVEAGWALHRDWWGRGLATEGGRASVECWREHLDDPQLLSITLPGNARSRAVMERLGLPTAARRSGAAATTSGMRSTADPSAADTPGARHSAVSAADGWESSSALAARQGGEAGTHHRPPRPCPVPGPGRGRRGHAPVPGT